jgi:peroxiredoxin
LIARQRQNARIKARLLRGYGFALPLLGRIERMSATLVRTIAFGAILLGLAGSGMRAEVAEALPRYQLEVGQEIHYQAESHFKYGDNALDDQQQWRLWVVAARAGGWRLIVENQRQRGSKSLGRFELLANGTIVPNRTLGYQLDPSALLVPLPSSAAEAASGWQSMDKQKQLRRQFRIVENKDAEADQIAIEFTSTSPMDEIYLSTSSSKALFDTAQGLVEKVETDTTQKYGIDGKGTSVTVLKGVERRDGQWIKTFAAEADLYFEADQKYDERVEQAQTAGDKASEILDDAKQILVALEKKLSIDELKLLASSKLESHESLAKYYQETAERLAKIIGKPAYEFDTTDMDGHKHALTDYRGKVVVLDFWYRGCGWCIRAMPQIKQIATTFEDQPVAVLGMNTDRDEQDARFVVDRLGLNYPSLKADGLPEKFGVRGFPTLLVIDRQGIVQDVHIGYSADLNEKLGQSIHKLLK